MREKECLGNKNYQFVLFQSEKNLPHLRAGNLGAGLGRHSLRTSLVLISAKPNYRADKIGENILLC